jgi:hypothetical protein
MHSHIFPESTLKADKLQLKQEIESIQVAQLGLHGEQ